MRVVVTFFRAETEDHDSEVVEIASEDALKPLYRRWEAEIDRQEPGKGLYMVSVREFKSGKLLGFA